MGRYYNAAPTYYLGYPKRDHNFGNHPPVSDERRDLLELLQVHSLLESHLDVRGDAVGRNPRLAHGKPRKEQNSKGGETPKLFSNALGRSIEETRRAKWKQSKQTWNICRICVYIYEIYATERPRLIGGNMSNGTATSNKIWQSTETL